MEKKNCRYTSVFTHWDYFLQPVNLFLLLVFVWLITSVGVEVIFPLRTAVKQPGELLLSAPSAPLSQVHHYWDVECRRNVAAGSSDCTLHCRNVSAGRRYQPVCPHVVSTHHTCRFAADPNHLDYWYFTLPEGTQPPLSARAVLFFETVFL